MQSNGEKSVFLVLHRRRFPLASYLLVQKFGARNILATNISAHVLHRWPLMRKLPHKHVHQQAVVAGNCRKTVCSLVQNVSKNCRERFINRCKMNLVTVNILPTKMHNCAKGTHEQSTITVKICTILRGNIKNRQFGDNGSQANFLAKIILYRISSLFYNAALH